MTTLLRDALREIGDWDHRGDSVREAYDEKHGAGSYDALAESAQPAAQVPAGWQLVPVEPPDSMMDHFCGTKYASLNVGKRVAEQKAYRAMLAAAPSAHRFTEAETVVMNELQRPRKTGAQI